jgi:hypothetical protein
LVSDPQHLIRWGDVLIDGYWFYERQHPGLADYFRSCLIVDIETLTFQAGIHEVIFGFHRLLSKRFPFHIYYASKGDSVLVVAGLDARRNPLWTRQRLGIE